MMNIKILGLTSLLLLIPSVVGSQPGKNHTIQVPYAILREKPEKLGYFPKQDNMPIAILKQGDAVVEQSPQDSYCQQKGKKKYCDWTYLQDWKYVKSASNPNQKGWIHKLLLNKENFH